MRLFLIFFFAVTFAHLNFAQTKVLTGLEVLKKNNFELLEGYRVGLITNPTGIDKQLNSTVDLFYNSDNVNLVALYGPEHGVRGDHTAGEHVDNYIDEYTKLPVYSLYGKSRKPPASFLQDVDLLVYDIQDIGSRSYTYISTMGLAMEAAAENNIKFMVLDRPNPLGGNLVEGNLVEDGFISFVSQFKIPYIYGLTAGELALYINDEVLSKKNLHCDLEIIKMKNWHRDMIFEETGLPWVLTSPHIPHASTAFYYAISGVVGELNAISIGVGYTIPFETFAAPWIDAKLIADKMNSYNLPGVKFRPITYKPYYATYKGEYVNGVQVFITNYKTIKPLLIQFYFLKANHELYPDKNIFELSKKRLNMFDKVCGTDKIRLALQDDFNFDYLLELLNKDAENFRRSSKKYWLYE